MTRKRKTKPKPAARRPRKPPAEQAEQAPRTPRLPNGQFPPGSSGNPRGRPPGVRDLRVILSEAFEAQGQTLETVAVAICAGLLKAAQGGDVPAGRLLLDRLYPQKLEVGESFADLIRGAWERPGDAAE